jgi:Calcineurin-like phosphoesterase
LGQPRITYDREEFDLIKPRARTLVAMGVLGLVPLGLVAPPAYANTTVTGSCTDGGGIVWQTKVEWKGTYVRSGVTKVGVDYAGWSTNRGSTPTDSIVKTYGPDGKLLNTQRRTATFDYKSGSVYDFRNPVNPPSSPGKSKVTITLGRDGDGFGNCTVTYVQPSTSADPVIAAVGDMVCKPGATVTSTACQHKAVSSSILRARPAAFLALGDLQYNNGELANFKTAYETSYGRFKASTRPAPGNEDYATAGAFGYFSYFGALAGSSSKGYRSFNLGDWHIVQLNTERDISASGAQVQWLKSDLAANTKRCVLAYMHKPRWGNTDRPEFQPIYSAMVAGGVTLLLTGHEHNYQAQPKRDASGAESSTGIAQYVIGTGGRSVWRNASDADQKPIAFNSSTFGWLKLTLHSTSADLKFVPVGGSFTDSRRVTCNP